MESFAPRKPLLLVLVLVLSSPTSSMTLARETFTVWMKSLVCHSNGCTVYDSEGRLVYRVENYDTKCSDEVHLMDHRGKSIYTIRKAFKCLAFGRWDGYRSSSCICSSSSSQIEEKPWFKVKRSSKLLMASVVLCQIEVGCDLYFIVRQAGKVAFGITNVDGDIVAEAKQKHLSSGINLGDDVLTLEMNRDVDHSLIMAFVTVYGLIFGKM